MVRFRNSVDYYTIYNFIYHCIPSFALLYSMEEVLEPQMTLKLLLINGIGHMNMVIWT